MSSIIDALKKSDQNRSSNNQADINNIKFSDTAPKSRRGFWLLVIILLLIAGGVFAWQQGWHQPLMNLWPKPQTSGENAQPLAKTPTPAKPTVTRKEPSSKDTEPNKQLVPPKQSEIREKTEIARKEQLNKVVKLTETQPQKPNKNQSGTPKSNIHPLKEAPTKPLKKNQANNKTDQATKQESSKPKAKTDQSLDDLTTNKKPQKPVDSVTKQDYLLLHQIDFAVRKDIPQIKINIHIYDPEPENRMVLINGERYNIGDTIEDVLTVSDIVKEGIVVSFANLKFLIPK